MFDKETYVKRRNELKRLVGKGIVILFGNNESPANYPTNAYYPFRQDSAFIYYFGMHRDGLVGIIDIDNDRDTLVGNDIDIEDIVWFGSVDSVGDMASKVGVEHTAPMKELKAICDKAVSENRRIHFLPPYRHDTMVLIMDLLAIHPSQQRKSASIELINAVVKMRSTKEPQEIEAIERACEVGYRMHTTAMRLTRPGVTERYVGGQVDGTAASYSSKVSFATIFTQHGEVMHGGPSDCLLEPGRLALWAEWGSCAGAFVMIFCFAVTDNIAYSNLQKRYEKTYAYCVRLLDRIEQTEGYYPGIPIAMIGVVGEEQYPSTDLTLQVTSNMIGMNGDSLLYRGDNYREFMKYYLGATLNILPAEAMEEMYYSEEYKSMESFPGKDSIRIIDGILYIKTENESRSD